MAQIDAKITDLNRQQTSSAAFDQAISEKESPVSKGYVRENEADSDSSSVSVKEILDLTKIDPVLAKKLAIANQGIDDIGMTPYHWQLFLFNGFGYAVDSLLIVNHSIANPAVRRQYGQPSKHVAGIPLASQVGLLVGAAAWGFSADVIGRKLAFNTSLFSCALFVLIAAGMPSYISFSALVALYSAGAGGNYILDATNFLEFLPTTHNWLVTFMSVWWQVGYMITGFLAWAFMSNYSCPAGATPATCKYGDNLGWRYLHITSGGLVLVAALVRVLLFRMQHTPRWLLSQNRDAEVVEYLDKLALKYGKSHSVTLAQLQAEGDVRHTELSVWSAYRLKLHFTGLFETRKLGWSTTVILANWFVIGMVSPLYSVFLPSYLASRGAVTGDGSNYQTWRDYAINQAVGIVGPIIAGVLVETKFVGRRGTLAIGAAITMALNFAYTQIKTEAQNVGISAAITAAGNIYYGTIYAYTPEILPAAHRATGYGLCVVMNRIGGILGVLVGGYANVETTAPLFVCAGLFGLLVILSLLLPFESRGKRAN